MTDEKIVWKSPDPIPAGLDGNERQLEFQRRRRLAIALQKRPDEWAVMGIYNKRNTATVTASLISNGKSPAFGVGYKASCRTTGDAEYTVFVKKLP